MATKFMIQFDSDSDQENQAVSSQSQTFQNLSTGIQISQSMILKSDKKEKDKYGPNKISRNQFFNRDDLEFHHDNISLPASQIFSGTNQAETSMKKSGVRRKKGDTTIKLQPLKTLQLRKNIQKIDFIKAPQLAKTQSKPQQSKKWRKKRLGLTSVYRQNLLNFQMVSSSDEQNGPQEKLQDLKKEKSQMNQESNLFFNDSDSQEQTAEKNIFVEQQKEISDYTISKPLEKKRSQRNNKNKEPTKKSLEKESQLSQNRGTQSQQNQEKVGIQEQLNPELPKSSDKQITNNLNQLQQINQHPINYQQKSQFENIKDLLVNTMMKNSVLNLQIKRIKSLLNFFSPQFRVDFSQDKYFLMNSKKTSSKPTSTFIFTGSKSNFEEISTKYLGKMKSNLSGSVYNIFSAGLNPSEAKSRGVAPRQLLATVVYQTELFGTGRPKQFIVFVKNTENSYYCDLKGVRMYHEEVPLNQLYANFNENMDKIHVFHTRLPIYCKQTKEYVMNFEGKVKLSSIKNFILEDRKNGSQKVMLFGKITEEEYALDVHSPLTPLVGIGIAMTVFDSRIGSD